MAIPCVLIQQLDMTKKPTYKELERKIAELEDSNLRCLRKINDLEALIRNTSDFLMVLDSEFKVCSINQPLATFQIDDVIGKSFFEFVDSTHQKERKKQFRKVVATKQPVVFKSRFRTPLNENKYYDNKVAPLIENSGVKGLLICSKDITEFMAYQDEFAESEGKWRTLAEVQTDYLALLDRNFIIQYTNRPFPGMMIKDVLARSYFDFLPKVDHKKIRAVLSTVLETGKDMSYESYYDVRHFDDSISDFKHFDIHICPISKKGAIDGLALCFKDISERKDAERLLIASEEKYRTLIDNINQGIFRTSPDGKIIHTNKVLAQMSGFDSFKEIENTSVIDLYENKNRRNEILKKLEQDGQVKDFESAFIRKDGSKFWGSVSAKLIKDKKGDTLFIDGIIEDISEKKLAEEKWHGFMESATDCFLLYDDELNLIELNTSALKLFFPGTIEKENIIGRNITRLVPIIKKSGFYETLLNVIHTGSSYIEFDRPADLEVGKKYFNIKAFKMVHGLGIILTDTTEYRQILAALHESEKLYQKLVESMNDGLGVIDENGIFTYANRKLAQIHGGFAQDIVGQSIEDFFSDDNFKIFLHHFEKMKHGEYAPFEISFRGGDNIKTLARVSPASLFSDDGEFQGGFAIVSDITEQKKMEKALKESEARARVILNSSPDAITLLDTEGVVLDMNNAGLDRLKSSRSEIIGKNIFKLLPKELAAKRMKDIENVIGQKRSLSNEDERDGLILYNSSYPVLDQNGNVTHEVVFSRDITKTKELQSKLIIAERFAATGQLATSIAHEINSPLQGILNLIHLMKSSAKDDDDQLENLDLLKKGFNNIHNIVQHLLDMNRPGQEKKRPANINNIVQSTVALIKSYIKRNRIKIVLDLSPDIMQINVSPQQIGQVLINILNNSIEAIGGGEDSKKGDADLSGSSREITVQTCIGNGKIIVKISDTGPGIREKNMDNLFDPFYTSKKTMGMGIGLSVCHNIIQDHSGTINIVNAPEGGAVCTITLPVG